jgi:PAS domain S-box-containing protein
VEQRRRFEAALARAPVVLFTQDRDLRYTWVHNPSFGDPAGMIGKTDAEIMPAASAAVLTRVKRRVLESGQGVREEISFETPLGQRYFDLTVEPLLDSAGQLDGIACAAIDISERVLAQAATQLEQQRFRLAAEAVNGIIYEFDAVTGHVERTRGLFEVCGYLPDEVPPTAAWWQQQIHPDDRAKLRMWFEPEPPHRCFSEYRARHRDGRWLHVEDRGVVVLDEAGNPRSIVGCTIDVTARRQVENQLRERTRQLDFALASTGVGMWLNPMPLGTLHWDRRTRELFFVGDDETPTVELFWDRLHPDDREPTRHAIEEAVRTGSVYAIDHRAVDPRTGAVHWIRSSGLATYGPDGTPTRFDGINYDITERKQQEASLQSLTCQLQENDARKDRFLATLAHELRNPLAPIRNAVQILAAAPGDRDKVEWSSAVIGRQLSIMSRLLDDLLDLSRISQGKLALRTERANLRAVLEAALETSRPLLDAAGHDLEVRWPDGDLPLVCDPVRLAQVFSNLLNNAAKYTNPGGRIVLAVERLGEQWRVEVSDNGIGVSETLLPRIFEMFAQGQRAQSQAPGGLGVGLALVRGLVELHGGSITAHSEGVDRGSTFAVLLPGLPVARTGEPAAPGRVPAPGTCPARRRVLVVDDVRDSADSLAMLLELDGHDVRTAYDGRSALALVEEFGADVVVLDLGLPDMSGLDACRTLRARPGGERRTIVALTGWGLAEDRGRTRSAGFDHHLVKPVDPVDLLAVIAGT